MFLGIDPRKTLANLRAYPKYTILPQLKTLILSNLLGPVPDAVCRFCNPCPTVDELYSSTGYAS